MNTADKIVVVKCITKVCERLFNKKRKVSIEEMSRLIRSEVPKDIDHDAFSEIQDDLVNLIRLFIQE